MSEAAPDRALFDREGRVWFRGLLSEQELVPFDKAVAGAGAVGGRLALDAVLTAELSRRLAARFGFAALRPTRMVAFTKSEAGNWGVPWHQDRVIAVAARHDVSGFGNWSRKSGIWHCEPPASVLEQMLFVRVHLDDAAADAGAMQIAIGSHRLGRVASDQAEVLAQTCLVETTQARRGDVLMMHMLLLHCSKPALVPQPRRVIRVDFAHEALPRPLAWPTVKSVSGQI